MSRLKNVIRWMQFAMLFTGFGFAAIGFRAIDDKISYDAVSQEKIGMLHLLGIMFAIWALILFVAWLAYRTVGIFRSNDPDVGTNDDSQFEFAPDTFPSSPTKPR